MIHHVAAQGRRHLVHVSLQGACMAMLLLAFDTRQRPSTMGVRPATPVVAASSAAASPGTVALILDPRYLDASVGVVERTGGVERVVVGPLRAVLTANQVALADERFASPIAGVARITQGWLFVAADGTVARASHFLGPLQLLGRVPPSYWIGGFGTLPVSTGRLAFPTSDPHASLWTTDGSAPIAPARGLPPGVVQSVAFVDADHGMIVVDGGDLFVTRDGARSFHRIDLGDDAATAVMPVGGALKVATSSGLRTFDADGAPTGPAEAETMPRTHQAILEDSDDQAMVDRIYLAVVRRYAPLVADGLGWVVDREGRVLVPVDHQLKPITEASDQELAVFRHMNHCPARRWGKDYALACFEEGLFRADGTTLRGTLVNPAWRDSGATISSDGAHTAWVCDRRAPPDPFLCMQSGGHIARRPRGIDRVLGSRGDEVVVETSERGGGIALAVVDAATGLDRRVFVPPVPSNVSQMQPSEWEASADGAIALRTIEMATGEHLLLRVDMSSGATLTRRLPDGAVRAGFVTAEHGVAADTDGATVWLTHDGGAHWRAQAVVARDVLYPSRPPTLRDSMGPPSLPVRCRDDRCRIDERIVVAFDRSIPSGMERVFVAPGDSAAPPRPTDAAQLDCSAHTIARPALVPADLESSAFEIDGIVQFQNLNVDATLHVTAGGRWEVTWRGQDWRGAYGARRVASVVAPRDVEGEAYELRSATRDGVVIEQRGREQRVVWLSVAGASRVIGDGSAKLEDILALPDGRLAVLLGIQEPAHPEPSSSDYFYHQLLLLGRDGGLVARRTYAWDHRVVGIAWRDGAVGVQFAQSDATSPHGFLPIAPAAELREPGNLAPASLPICTDRAGMGDLAAIGVEDGSADTIPPYELPITRIYVRGKHQRCVQAVEFRDPLVVGRNVFAAATGGVLRARLDVSDINVLDLRCRFEPATDGFATALEAHEVTVSWATDPR